MEKNFTSISNKIDENENFANQALSTQVSNPKLDEFTQNLTNLICKFSAIIEYGQTPDEKMQSRN